MKKSIALVALAFGVTSAFAQDLTSKKGEPILPEAGDWGLAIDATPFLDYAGNFFGKQNANNAPTWNFFTNAQTITGRYFSDAQTVYRGSVRIGFGSNTNRAMVSDRAAASSTTISFPTAVAMKENEWKRSTTTIGLAGGIEMRKGKTRLQGYYGGEVGIYFSSSKDKFTYGNALNAPNAGVTNPVTVDATDDAFGGASNINTAAPIQGIIGDARATERKNGATFSFGLRGFIGAEYFVLPKMSIGGEFGWGLGLTSVGKTSTTWESIGQSSGATSQSIGTTTIEGSKSGSFALDTDGKNSVWGPAATLRLNLYF